MLEDVWITCEQTETSDNMTLGTQLTTHESIYDILIHTADHHQASRDHQIISVSM